MFKGEQWLLLLSILDMNSEHLLIYKKVAAAGENQQVVGLREPMWISGWTKWEWSSWLLLLLHSRKMLSKVVSLLLKTLQQAAASSQKARAGRKSNLLERWRVSSNKERWTGCPDTQWPLLARSGQLFACNSDTTNMTKSMMLLVASVGANSSHHITLHLHLHPFLLRLLLPTIVANSYWKHLTTLLNASHLCYQLGSTLEAFKSPKHS